MRHRVTAVERVVETGEESSSDSAAKLTVFGFLSLPDQFESISHFLAALLGSSLFPESRLRIIRVEEFENDERIPE